MKKYAATILAGMLLSTPVLAESQTFYSVDVRPGQYFVYGVTSNGQSNDNPACYAQITWRDGSRIQLIRDLADGELYIFFRNMTWNISDAPGEYRLRLNFHRSNGVNGADFVYNLVNKNTITIRHIKKEVFLPLFSGYNKMIIAMPGSIQNAEVDLTGSTNALAEISKCVLQSSSVNLYPNGRGQNNNNNPPRRFDNINYTIPVQY